MNTKYIPTLNNTDSFIAYKFSIMPSTVFSNSNYEESYPLVFMNNEILKVLEIELSDIFSFISLNDFINIRKLINEEISFYNSYNTASQSYSKKYKTSKISINNYKPKKDEIGLIFAKYLCFKEAYDLELDFDKIYNFNIDKATTIKNILDLILSPIYSEKIATSIRKTILKKLNDEIKKDGISTTFESEYSLYNINHFKALICSNEIIDKIVELYNQDKLSIESIDFCVEIISLSIYAKNKTLKKNKLFVIDEKDIESFDKDIANDLKNKLICKKYKRLTIM